MPVSSISGTGNQPYTPARVDYLASYYQSLLPGLSHEAAVKWINAERGVNGNVLGVTFRDASGQHLYTYGSQEAGLRAAAALVRSSSDYAGIRSSLGKSTIAQLTAIAASPWSGAGYYRRAFGIGGATDGATTVPGIKLASTSTNPDIAGVDQIIQNLIQEQIKGFDPNAKIDPGLLTHLAAIAANGDAANAAKIQGVLAPYFDGNHTWGDLSKALPGMSFGVAPAGSVFGPVADNLAKLTGFLLDFENIKFGMALLVGIPLALFGFYLLAGVQTGGQNA